MTKKKRNNNNIGKVTIPKKYKTNEEKLGYLTETIEEKCSKLTTTKGKATASKIQIGQYLNALKPLIKSEENFTDYIEENFPFDKRTAQRYMKLAQNVPLDEHEDLAFLGSTPLITLIGLAKGKSLTKYLKKNNISVNDVDPDDIETVYEFQEDVKNLINNQKGPAKTKVPISKTLSNLKKTLDNHLSKIKAEKSSDFEDIVEEISELIDSIETLIQDSTPKKKPAKKKKAKTKQ